MNRRKTKTIELDPSFPKLSPEDRAWLGDLLNEGGVAVFPTDTVYGIGCRWDRPEAIERIIEIKGREPGKPLPMLAEDLEACFEIADCGGKAFKALAGKYWPGALTLLAPALENAVEILHPALRGDFVGFRVPDCIAARQLAGCAGGILASSSANRSGDPPFGDRTSIDRFFSNKVDVIITAGFRSENSLPSTVVECGGSGCRIVREGAVAKSELAAQFAAFFSEGF